jgi:hypothetical protein
LLQPLQLTASDDLRLEGQIFSVLQTSLTGWRTTTVSAEEETAATVSSLHQPTAELAARRISTHTDIDITETTDNSAAAADAVVEVRLDFTE